MTTVFVGVIPGVKNMAGVLFRTDLDKSYHKEIAGAKYQCEINGGRNKYFFIEERYWIDYPNSDKPSHVGNIKQIHHFNQDNEKQKEQATGESNKSTKERLEIAIAIGAITIGVLYLFTKTRNRNTNRRNKNRNDKGPGASDTTQDSDPSAPPKKPVLQLPGGKT